KLRPRGLLERNRSTGDVVHMRPTLQTGKYGRVDRFGQVLAAENQTAAGSPQSFMGCGGDDVKASVDRIMHHAGGDESADMRDVGHRHCRDVLGDGLERRVLVITWIGRVTAQHKFRIYLSGELRNLVKIDRASG